jgi:hypothetical protein
MIVLTCVMPGVQPCGTVQDARPIAGKHYNTVLQNDCLLSSSTWNTVKCPENKFEANLH